MKSVFITHMIIMTVLLSGCFSDTSEKYLNDLKSNNISVRQNAVYNLGKSKEIKATPMLIQLLKNERSKTVRLYIIDALIEINEKNFVETLIDKLKKNDNKIQIASSVEALIELLDENDSEIQIAAIDALGEMAASDAVQPLIKILNSSDRSIKLTVLRALGNIKNDAAVPTLTILLNDQDQYVKYNAAQTLKKIGDK